MASATRGAFETTVDEDAKTRLRERYVVSAPLAGLLSRIDLREGDAVEADAVVATLTPSLSPMLDERTLREQQLRVEIAEAQAKRVDARIEGAKVALLSGRQRSEAQRAARGARVSSRRPSSRPTASSALAAQKDARRGARGSTRRGARGRAGARGVARGAEAGPRGAPNLRPACAGRRAGAARGPAERKRGRARRAGSRAR